MEDVKCKMCDGTGMADPDCPECEGCGWVEDPENGGTMSCPECGGDECAYCDGTGRSALTIVGSELLILLLIVVGWGHYQTLSPGGCANPQSPQLRRWADSPEGI